MSFKSLSIFLRSDSAQTISQLILGGIFIYASLGKLLNPGEFAKAIGNYKILSPFLVKITAYILPVIELTFGVLLVLKICPRLAAFVLALLLVIFIAAISSALIRGINVKCGCIIQSYYMQQKVTAFDNIKVIIRDLLLLIPGIIIFFNKKKE